MTALTGLDVREHSAVIKALIEAQGKPAYDYGDVPGAFGNPGVLPDIYNVVSVERRFNPPIRLSAETDIYLWRVVVQHVGRAVYEAQSAHADVTAALNEAVVTIDGVTYGPIQFELDQAPEPDDGRFTGRSQWTY